MFNIFWKEVSAMPIYEKLMGNPFVDVGVCSICEWLGRKGSNQNKSLQSGS